MENINGFLQLAKVYISQFGLKLLGAIIVLLIGLWVIKLVANAINKGLSKSINDPSLSSFLKSFISALLKVLLAITIMSMVGIQMTSFIAILGAAGLAVGMALSGTLQNFAGGVMVLIFKPFKVGDFIEVIGHAGKVKEIQIFNTIMNTTDNRIIIVPNGKIYSESIINYSQEPLRRVDFTFEIGYDSDIDKAKSVIFEILKKNDLVLDNPAPFIALKSMGDSSINLTVRAWVESANYWSVFFTTNEEVFKAFKQKDINIPYKQMDIHIKNNN